LLARVLKNSLAMTTANVVLRMGDLIIAVLASRLLNMEDFGKYVFVLSFYSIFKLASGGGPQNLLVRDMAQDKDRVAYYFGEGILFEVVWSILLAVVYTAAVFILKYPPDTTLGLFIALLALLPDGLALPALSAIQAFEKMRFLVIINSIAIILRVGLSVAALLLGYGFIGVVVCMVISRLGCFVAAHGIATTKVSRPEGNNLWRNLAPLVRRLAPFLCLSLLSAIFLRADMIILSQLKGEETIAIMGAGIRLIEPALLIVTSFMLAIYPTLSESFTREKRDFALLYSGSIRSVSLGLMIVICLGDVLAGPAVAILFPPGYAEAALVTRVFLWYLAFFALSQVTSRVLMGIGRQDIALGVLLFCVPLIILLNYMLIPVWGAPGAAAADLIAMGILAILQLRIVARKVPEVTIKRELILPLIVTLIALTAGRLVGCFGWGVQLVVVAAVLFFLVLLFKLVKSSDVRTLLSTIRGCFAR